MSSVLRSTTPLDVLRIITLSPELLAALIGCIPLIIPCVTCRCCQALVARARSMLDS